MLFSCDFFPDGKNIVTTSLEGEVAIFGFDGSSAKLAHVQEINTDMHRQSNIVFCSKTCAGEGEFLVGAESKKASLLKYEGPGKDYSVVREFKGHTNSVRSIAFSPDKKSLLTSSEDHTVLLHDYETGEAKLYLSGHHDLVVSSIIIILVRVRLHRRENSGEQQLGLAHHDLEALSLLKNNY